MKTLYRDLLVIIVVLGLISACGGNQMESAEDKLTGEWRNISIDVKVETAGGSDTSRVLTVDRQNWVQKLGIQPVRTFYNADGSYTSKYYSPDDSLIMENSGTWEVKDDSLYMYQSEPDSVTYIADFTVEEDTARFEMMLDWDQDGEKDDYYVGIQKRHEN